jgi:hypothetical protein
MKFFIPTLIVFFCCCKNNGLSQAEKKRIQDSLDIITALQMVDPSKREEMENIILSTDSATNEVQKLFDAALIKYDSLATYDDELEGKLNDGISEVSKLKSQITEILKNRQLSEAERSKAQKLINDLNGAINKLIKVEPSKK